MKSITKTNVLQMADGVLYIVHEREFLHLNVFKIGSTQEIKQRLNGYKKGSRLLFCISCANHKHAETEVRIVFCRYFERRIDLGNEYFEGDITMMKEVMFKFVTNTLIYKHSQGTQVDMNSITKQIVQVTTETQTDNINVSVSDESDGEHDDEQGQKFVSYACKRCGYKTTRLSSMKNHLLRQNPCKDLLRCNLSQQDLVKNLEKKEYKHICPHCESKYKSLSGFLYHMNTCKKEFEIFKLQDEITKLKCK